MSTVTASGHSKNSDPLSAAREAIAQARAGLGERAPLLGFVFASPKLGLPRFMQAAQAEVPGVQLIGCSTAGEISERGLSNGGASVLLVASDEMLVDVAMATQLREQPEPALARLAAPFLPAEEQARKRGLAHSSAFVLCDGLSPTIEKIVNDLRKHTRPFQQLVGGGAGDDMALKDCQVGRGKEVASDAAVVMHLFGRKAVGVGVHHGLEPTTERMVATRAQGNVVQEINGRNAFEVYREYAKARGVTLTPDNAGPFLIQHEIGLMFFDDLVKARAPLAVTPDGALVCGGIVEQGASICFVEGKPAKMIDAARDAAREAAQALGGEKAAGVLMFDCVCRGNILGPKFQQEIEAVQSVFPGVPIAGYLSYGEIARFRGRFDGYHNNTIVVVALPA